MFKRLFLPAVAVFFVTVVVAQVNGWQLWGPFRGIFAGGPGGVAVTLPLEDNVTHFSELKENLTAEIGTDVSYTRAIEMLYFDTENSVAEVAANTPGFGTFWNSETPDGLLVHNRIRNRVWPSEDITDVRWINVGAPTKTADQATDPQGDTDADLLLANSNGDGIEQEGWSSNAGASRFLLFTGFVKRAGASDVALTLAQTPATGTGFTEAYTATNEWTRFTFRAEYTGSDSGNVTAKLTIDNAGESIHVWGLMLEALTGSPNRRPGNGKEPVVYVRTTTTTRQLEDARPVISSADINYTKGTISMWAANNAPLSDGGLGYVFRSSDNSLIFSGQGTLGIRAWYGAIFNQDNIPVLDPPISPLGKEYSNYVITFNNVAGDATVTTYVDGVLVFTNTYASPVPTGDLYLYGVNDTSTTHGLYRKIRIWDEALTDDQVEDVYNFDKGKF